MEFALSENGERIKATKHAKGFCNICGKPLRPHLHVSYDPHWAHLSKEVCDPWWEEESDWHKKWKNLVDEQFREVPIEKNGVKHRADICLVSGIVVELQHSALSTEERCERETFYERMIWIIHLPKSKIKLLNHCYQKDVFDDYYAQIDNIKEWVYVPPHTSPIFLDLGDDEDKIFLVTEFDNHSPKKRTRNIYGKFIDKKKFIDFFKPTFFDFDLNTITLSQKHRDFEERQRKIAVLRDNLKLLKKILHDALQQKKYKEQSKEWQKRAEEKIRMRQEIIKSINKLKNEDTWGISTGYNEKLSALEDELKKYPEKESWE